MFQCSTVYLTALINAIKAMLFLLAVELNFVLLKGIKIFRDIVTSLSSSIMLLWEPGDIYNSSHSKKREEIAFFLKN